MKNVNKSFSIVARGPQLQNKLFLPQQVEELLAEVLYARCDENDKEDFFVAINNVRLLVNGKYKKSKLQAKSAEALKRAIGEIEIETIEDGFETELYETAAQSGTISLAIALLQEQGYAVATTVLDNEIINSLTEEEATILAEHFQSSATKSRIYLVLSHLEEDFVELPDNVKPIATKIIQSIPQKSGRPELVLIEL